jgi:hypothetical protein
VRDGPDAATRDWLGSLCKTAFFLRVLLAMAIYHGPWDFYLLGEDQTGYDHFPAIVARYWSGIVPRPPFLSEPAYQERIGYFTLVTLQYYLVGIAFMLPRLVNCLAGALMVLYAYRLALLIFGPTEAKVAAVWTAYFPSLVLWSTLNMRDIWLALGVLMVVYHALRARERLSFRSLFVIALTLAWISFNRPALVIVLIGALGTIFGLARAQRLGRDVTVAVLVLGLIVFLQRGLGIGQQGLDWFDLARLTNYRSKFVNPSVGASGYLTDVNLANPGVLIGFLPLSLAYFLFSPFPWQMTAPRRLITLPEMIVWYWSFPFVVVAAAQVLRERTRRRLALLLPTLLITFAFAIGSSNIGLTYRYRAQVITLYLAFAAAGYVQRRASAGVAARN